MSIDDTQVDDTQVADVLVTDTPEWAAPAVRDSLRPMWLVAAACLLALGAAAAIATFPSMGQPGPYRAKAVAEQPPVTFATSAPATSPPAPVLASEAPGPTSPTPSPATSRTTTTPTVTVTTADLTSTVVPESTVVPDPIAAYSACTTRNRLRLTASLTDSFSRHRAFIKADDTSTGYPVVGVTDTAGNDFKADYMIQNETLYRSSDSGRSWRRVADARQSHTDDGTYRWQVRLARLESTTELEVVFNGTGNHDAYSEAVVASTC